MPDELIKHVNIDAYGIEMFAGPLEACIMRAIWAGKRNTRAIYNYVRTNYRSERSEELAFTSITSTVDRLYKRRWLHRDGDRNMYAYTPIITSEEDFITICLQTTIAALVAAYPQKAAKVFVSTLRDRGIGNGK